MKYQCKFEYLTWFCGKVYYTCTIADQQIIDYEDFLFIGQHENGRNRTDVKGIWFNNCQLTKIPEKLLETFPNLRAISIKNSNLRNLSRSDLIKYKYLEHLSFSSNKIEFLPSGLFDDFMNLKSISFSGNKLNIVNPHIFDKLNMLEYADFRENPNYDLLYSTSAGGSTVTLHEFKNVIYKKFYPTFRLSQEPSSLNENLYEHIQEPEITEYKKQETHSDQGEIKSESINNSQNYLFNDIKNLIQNETFKDFKIIIDDREFHVHKFLLAARSPTFAELFHNNPEAESLSLVDIPCEIFEKILTFIYTDEIPRDDGMNFLHLFAAASQLEIKILKNFAANEVFKDINEENAIEIFILSNKYGHEEMRQKAFDEIKKKFPKLDFKDEWIKDSEKIIRIIELFKAMF